ncbi:MAG: hypothetical protein H7A23_21035 [Leptospiraceae bacterium]|nr:hypothetical protein [Leptospiraceae bacterium]MCP5497048.1 hypothetical protein [Leptospiraceae bacterium]
MKNVSILKHYGKMRIFWNFFCFMSIVFPLVMQADTVYMKNGKRIDGLISSQSHEIIIIITNDGEVKKLNKSDTSKIFFTQGQGENKKPTPPKPYKKKAEKKNDKEDQGNRQSQGQGDLKNYNNIIVKSKCCELYDALERRVGHLEDAKREYDKWRKTVEKREAEHEIRLRRLEKYLGMDESMVDYYSRKRSPWDLVWRSTLFPGWGHRYAREEYIGNAYTTSIFLLAGLGWFITYEASALERVAKDKLITEAIVKPAAYSNILGASIGSINDLLGVSNAADYYNATNAISSQKKLGIQMMNLAGYIYLFQIAHAYFTGLDWARTQPRDYSPSGLQSMRGFNFSINRDRFTGLNGIGNSSTYSQLDYTFSF